MGVRILTGTEGGCDQRIACLFDSCSGTAFGPIFRPDERRERGHDDPQRFLDWYAARQWVMEGCPAHVPEPWPRDVRALTPARLAELVGDWRDDGCPDGEPDDPDMNAVSANERREIDARQRP